MFKQLVMMLAAITLGTNAAHAAPQQIASQQIAPQKIDAVYDLYRNGQKLGSVIDSFTRSGKQYQIVSETRAAGPLKLFWPGTIRLDSQGEVNENGLRPNSFRHARSDRPNKTASAVLDWNKRSIRFQYKSEIRDESGLRDRTQDQLSQLYQFVFMPRLPSDYSLDVVSGKTRNDYRYRQRDGGKISVPAGLYPVQEFDRILSPGDDKAITVWVAPGHNNFPVQIRVVEDGVTLEQRLVRLTIKP